MTILNPQVNSDALNHYFPNNGDTGHNYFVNKWFDVTTNRYVLGKKGIEIANNSHVWGTEVIEAATNTLVSCVELSIRSSEHIVPINVATWGRVSLYTKTTGGIHSSAVCSGIQNNSSLASDNIFSSLDEHLGIIYSLESARKHRAASQAIFYYIETNFSNSNLTAINLMLKTIELERLSKWSISGLVRFTARAKKHLPAWSSAYHKAKVVLTDQGENAESLLVGIKG